MSAPAQCPRCGATRRLSLAGDQHVCLDCAHELRHNGRPRTPFADAIDRASRQRDGGQ